MESNWRNNVWILNFDPLLVRLVARVNEGSIWDLTYMVNGLDNDNASFYFASPVTLPTFVSVRDVGGGHFPYDVEVLPDH